MKNMKVILSAAVSLDGCLDDNSPQRLKLSSAEDWQAVLALRGRCDAILVGAETIRKDNPSLVIRDEAVRAERAARGQDVDIVKVTLTRSGNIDPHADFFTQGGGRKIVFAPLSADAEALARLDAEIIQAEEITARFIADTLAAQGCHTLMVEGGGGIHTMFLTEGVADELRLAIAPFFVGDPAAPKFVGGGRFPWDKDNRMKLASVEMLGDMTVMHLRAALSDEDYLRMAIAESRKCTPVTTAYCVGAVIVTADGQLFKGYTHETDPKNHAEEEAVAKAKAAGADLRRAAMYSSMEPCSKRASKPRSCSRILIDEGFAKAVYALNEPPHFVECHGRDMLREAGLEVVHIPELGAEVAEINRHIG